MSLPGPNEHDHPLISTRYSEVHHAYNMPYYHPLTTEEKSQALVDFDFLMRSEAHLIHRLNTAKVLVLGGLGYILTYPLLRTSMMQWVRPDIRFVAPEINYRWSALKFTIQKEGPHRLWRGVFPGLFYFGGSVWAQQFCQDFFTGPNKPSFPTERGNISEVVQGAAYATGVSTIQLLLHPLRIAQTKLATDLRIRSLSTWFRYATTFDCLLRVVRFNGVAGLFTGGTLMFIRNYLFWLVQFIQVNRLSIRDDEGHVARKKWKRWFYAYRYELRVAQVYVVLMPLEVALARRLYRIPTFKTDRLPSQFPKIWAPTFSGLLNSYRGTLGWFFVTFVMVLFSGKVSEWTKEVLLPPHLRPSYKSMLFYARYAQFQRRQDELKGKIVQFPNYDLEHGPSSQFHLNYQQTSHPVSRFSIGTPPDSNPLELYELPHDLDGIFAGDYDNSQILIPKKKTSGDHV